MGAHLNVRINTASLDDKAYVKDVLAKAERTARDAAKHRRIVAAQSARRVDNDDAVT